MSDMTDLELRIQKLEEDMVLVHKLSQLVTRLAKQTGAQLQLTNIINQKITLLYNALGITPDSLPSISPDTDTVVEEPEGNE